MSFPPPIHQVIFNGSAADVGTSPSTITIDDPSNRLSYTNVGGKDCMYINSDGTHPDVYVPCVFDHTQSFTFSIWVKFNNVAAWNVPFLLVGGDVNIMCAFNATQMFLSVGNGVDRNYDQADNGGKNFLEWSCITFFYRAGSGLFFGGVNGTVDIGLNVNRPFTTSHFLIGGQYTYQTIGLGGQVSWDGYVRQLNLFDYEMTYAQIAELYNSTGGNAVLNTPPPAAPTAPILSIINEITHNSFTVNWTGGTGATSYTYTLNGVDVVPSNFIPISEYEGSNVATFTGLTPGTSYILVIRAVNSGGYAESTSESFTSLLPPPELNPTSISTNNVTPYKTRADWYIIGYDSLTFTLNGLAVTPEYMSDSFAIFSGLTPLTEYTLVTTATNQYGSTVSTPRVFTTMDPLMPYDVSGSATETSLTASWLGGTDATSYTYTLNGIAATPSTDNSLTSKSVIFTGLSPSTEYTLIVNAIAGSNIQSSVYFGVIVTSAPSPPVLTSIVLTYSGSSVMAGNEIYLSATATDQSGNPFNTNLTLSGYNSFTGTTTTYNMLYNVLYEVRFRDPNIGNFTYIATSDGIISNSVFIEQTGPQPLKLFLKASSYTSGVWIDESAYEKNATLAQGTAAKNAAGNGIILDGSTRWTFPNLDLGNMWTMNVWYKGELPAGNPCILTQQYVDGQLNMFLGVGAGSTTVSGGFLNNYWWTGTPIILSNNWVNIQITWDGLFMTTYINGALTGSRDMYAPSLDNGMPYNIGCGWSNTDFIVGEIGEVRIYNTPLSQGEVAADFAESVSTFLSNSIYGITKSSTETSLTVTWFEPIGASSREYTLNGISITPTEYFGGNTSTHYQRSATLEGLSPSTIYTFVVTSIYESESLSATVQITTLAPPPPTDLLLTITNIVGTSFGVSWTGGDGATSYTYTLNYIATTPSSESISGKTATFTGLSNSTNYRLDISAINSGGVTSAIIDVVTQTAPIINITGSVNNTPTSTTVSYIPQSFSFVTLTLNGINVMPEDYNNGEAYLRVMPGTEYTLIVTATLTHADGDISTVSDPFVFTSMDQLTPYNLELFSNTTTSMTIKWKGGIGATSYSYAFKNRTFLPTVIDNGLNSVTFIGLPADESSYEITVTAINSTKSIESAVLGASTLGFVTQPTIDIIEITPYSFDVFFNSGNYTSHTFTFNGVSATPIITVQGNYRFSGLIPLTEYTVGVTVMNDGSSATSDPFSITTLNALAPYRAHTTYRDNTSVIVRWQGGIGATSYQYTVREFYTDALVEPEIIDNGLSNSVRISGLLSNTSYRVNITSVNSTDSFTSQVDLATALAETTDLTTPILSISDITQTSFKASWTGDAAGYDYRLNGEYLPPTTALEKYEIFTNLSPSTTYTFTLLPYDVYGHMRESHVVITTLGALPPSVPVVTVSEITQTSFRISSTSTGATSYTYTLNGVSVTPISQNNLVFTRLTKSTVYSLVVQAVNANGTNSTTVSITTLAPPLANVLLLKAIDYRRGVWQDQSSSANNASLEFGTATKNAAGNGIVLNGQTSWKFPNLELGNAWTAAVWYKQTQAVNGASILTQKGANTNLSIVDNSNGGLNSGFYNNAWYTGQPVTLNGWTNVQATWDGTALKTYLNGTLTDTSTGGTSIDSTLGYGIGSRDGITFAKGEIGEVRIYNYPLTQEQVTADYNGSYNTFATPVPGVAPTALANVASNTVTGSSFGVSWTGGFGATSYTYTLNGSPATPSSDKGTTAQTAVFTGLTHSVDYYLIVTAVNETGSEVSTPFLITTLGLPAPVTVAAVAAVQDTFVAVSTPAAAATAIEAALAANVAPQTLVAAALTVATPAMFTALVNNPAFIGTAVSVPPAAAAALYAAFSPTVTVDTSLPLEVNFPAVDGSVKPPTAASNSKLAIDLTRDTFVPFSGATGYGIDVIEGIQYFVTPTNTGTIVNVGDQITFTLDSGSTVTFVVADLDIVFAPYTPPPPVVICFLGSAPVLTPSGYRRIDRLAVGDIVKTPTGTAFVELIKKQSYTPGPTTNPYIIPEGLFGANRKLHISPRHKVAIDGHMIEARYLGLEQDEYKNPIIYYNIQITKSQNIIVAGVEVESLQPLVRITVSREAFNYTLATQHGGMLTDEIRANCHFLPDGRVSVPSIKS